MLSFSNRKILNYKNISFQLKTERLNCLCEAGPNNDATPAVLLSEVSVIVLLYFPCILCFCQKKSALTSFVYIQKYAKPLLSPGL